VSGVKSGGTQDGAKGGVLLAGLGCQSVSMHPIVVTASTVVDLMLFTQFIRSFVLPVLMHLSKSAVMHKHA
jgi:hypothetical protein